MFSTVGQANALAATLATAIVMTLMLVAGAGRLRLAILGFLVVFVSAALVVTFSRGGYVALALGVCAAGAVLLPAGPSGWLRRHGPRVAAGAAAAMFVIGVLAVAWQPARDLTARVVARTVSIADASESSNRAHLDLWAVGVRIALEHPLVGTGPDSYVLLFHRYRDEVLPPDRSAVLLQFRPESPHNVYIATAAGSGIPALVAFLALVGTVLFAAARTARLDLPLTTRLALAALVGAVTVQLVTNMFVTAEPATSAVFWIALGSLAGVAALARTRVEAAA